MRPRALNLDATTLENESRRKRTRWSFGISSVAHVLAFLLLTAARPIEHHQENLVEITLLDEGGGGAGGEFLAGLRD